MGNAPDHTASELPFPNEPVRQAIYKAGQDEGYERGFRDGLTIGRRQGFHGAAGLATGTISPLRARTMLGE